ncbi:MFS transporter [Paenibacillus ferrarius]|uniref:MFS transporter n=1 Tax=Paenibacillus ferrarius TaxID=1469647 RepID=UPI003D27A3CA
MTFFQFHPNVRLRIALSFLTNVLSNMILPFMSIYIARTLGTAVAGTATTISIAVGLLAATIGGHYADRIGRKKMMLLGEGVALLAYVIMTFANSPLWHSAALTLLMTVISSASWGLSKPAVEAMLIDVSTPDTRKAIYRINYWSNNLAISFAGLIGGFFFSQYLFQLLLAASGMSLVAFMITAIFMSETMPAMVPAAERAATDLPAGAEAEAAVKPQQVSMFERYKEVLRDRRFVRYLLASVLVVSVEMNLNGYIGVRIAQDIQHTPWLPGLAATVDGLPLVGILRTENTIAVVLLSLFVGRLLRNSSDTRVMLLAMFLNVAGYSYLVIGGQPAMLLLLMLVATIGEITYVPLKQAMLVQLVPDHARSSYMALSSMTNRVAMMLSGLNLIIGGLLPSGAMAIFILVTGVAGIGLIASILPSLREEERVRQAAVL